MVQTTDRQEGAARSTFFAVPRPAPIALERGDAYNGRTSEGYESGIGKQGPDLLDRVGESRPHMESTLLKRAAPYVELCCFFAAWFVGVAIALEDREGPEASPRERNVVASDAAPSAADLSGPWLFRPLPHVRQAF